jgi:hypothetical protein
MAETYQQEPHETALIRFIEAGERELDGLEEPARTIRARALFAEAQHRFQPTTPIEIGEFTTPPSEKDVEEAREQKEIDTLEEKEIADGEYTHGDDAGEPRFKSHLKVKSVDNHPVEWDHQVITHVPDVKVMGRVAVKPDAVDLVSEGEIRTDERGHAEYKPTLPYHQRVSKWMFDLQWKKRPKQKLTCQRCEYFFEGRKGQKYCADCRKGKKKELVKEAHVFGECECDKCLQVYTIFVQLRLSHLQEKHGVEELTRGMELNDAEHKRFEELAKAMVNDDE